MNFFRRDKTFWRCVLGLTAAFLAVAILTLPTLAQTPDLGLNEAANIGLGDSDLKDVITNVVRLILGFLGLISVIVIIYGGYLWMTASGEVSQIEKAKKVLIGGIVGLIIILSAFVIAHFVIARFYDITDGSPCVGEECGEEPCFGPECVIDPSAVKYAFIKKLADPSLSWERSLAYGYAGVVPVPASETFRAYGEIKHVGGSVDQAELQVSVNDADFNKVSDYTGLEPGAELVFGSAGWNTSGYQISDREEAKIKANLSGLANIIESPAIKTIVRPAHCFNGLRDGGETNVDCGGECGACGGASCGDGCFHESCASGLCLAGSCLCASDPVIEQITPNNGAAGNYVTIWGRHFGNQTGAITFGDILASTDLQPDCVKTWTDTQIIVEVPDELLLGKTAVVVTTHPDLGLMTSNAVDFLVNEMSRSGICGVIPAFGRSPDQVVVSGNNFSVSDGAVVWTFEPLSTSTRAVGWTETSVVDFVPGFKDAGVTSIRIYNDRSGQYSNFYRFAITAGLAGHPCGYAGEDICSFAEACMAGLVCNRDCVCQTGGDGCAIGQIKGCHVGGCIGTQTCQVGSVWSTCAPVNPVCVAGDSSYLPATQAIYTWAFRVSEPFAADLCGNNQLDADQGEICDRVENDIVFASGSTGRQCGSYGKTGGDLVRCSASCQPDLSDCADQTMPAGLLKPATQAVYTWSFAHGQGGDFAHPYIVEECDRGDDCSVGAKMASPTPWSDGWTTATNPAITNRLACVNARVSARFNVSMDPSSVENNVLVLKCADRNGNGCAPVDGTINVFTAVHGIENGAFEFNPSAGDFLPNTWYKVILKQGVRSAVYLPMLADDEIGERQCNVAGITDAVYCWNFATRENAVYCPEGCVECYPDPSYLWWINSSADYFSRLDSADNACLILKNDNLWRWNIDKPAKVQIPSGVNVGQISVTAKMETIFDEQPYAKLTASRASGQNDYCRLHVDLTNIIVDEGGSCERGLPQSPTPWKFSENACTNALLSARFNRAVSDGTLNPDTLKFQRCSDSGLDCVNIGLDQSQISVFDYSRETTQTELFGDSANVQGVLPEGFVLRPDGNLLPNTWYRVVILGGSNGVKGAMIGADGLEIDHKPQGNLIVLNSDFDFNGDGAIDYFWTFKTGSDVCNVDKIIVSPAQRFMSLAGETQRYAAMPVARNCNLLNLDCLLNWDWRSLINLADPDESNSGQTVAAISRLTAQAGVCLGREDGRQDNVQTATSYREGGVYIKASANGRSGYGYLQVGRPALTITSRWPSCDGAGTDPNYVSEGICLNANVMTVKFSMDIQSERLTANRTIKVYKLNRTNDVLTEDRRLDIDIVSPALAGSPAANPKLTNEVSFVLTDGGNFERNSLYRVVITGGAAEFGGVVSWNNQELSGLNFKTAGDGQGEECEPGVYPWSAYSGSCESAGCLLGGGNLCHLDGIRECVRGSAYCDDTCHRLGNNNVASCGDSRIESGEECDDGNTAGGDGCNSRCLKEGANERWGSVCGNGRTEKGELCDDGNTAGGDGCSAVCLNESGRPAGSEPNAPICGNDMEETGEDCDDGNTVGGDGCSAVCLNEGSTTGAVCGNRLVEKNSVTDSYAWVFKAKDTDSICAVNRVDIWPTEQRVVGLNVTAENYKATPYSPGDDCRAGGQPLNQNLYSWSWRINPAEKFSLVDVLKNWQRKAKPLVGVTADDIGRITAETESVSCFDGDYDDCAVIAASCSYSQSVDPDSVCGDARLGVDNGGCCAARPMAVSLTAENLCPNGIIQVGFVSSLGGEKMNMDIGSLNFMLSTTTGRENIKLYYTAESIVFSADQGVNFIDSVKNVFKKLFIFLLPASATDWTEAREGIDYKFNFIDNQGGTEIQILPLADGADLWRTGYNYKLVILGDTDVGDTLRSGVLSRNLVAMRGHQEFVFQVAPAICQISQVKIYIEPSNDELADSQYDNFFCAGDNCGIDTPNTLIDDDVADAVLRSYPDLTGNQHHYRAQAYGADGDLSPLLAIYDWTLIAAPDDILSVNAETIESFGQDLWSDAVLANQSVFVSALSAKTRNGEATVSVAARPPEEMAVLFGDNVFTATKDVAVKVFLCDHPWPTASAFPYRDSNANCSTGTGTCYNTNFEIYYCRDRGDGGLWPDIGSYDFETNELMVPVLGDTNLSDDIIKEFLFFNNANHPNADPRENSVVGLRVLKNYSHYSPLTWYSRYFPAADRGAPQTLTVDGYQAIKDGRSVYINAADLSDDREKIYDNIYLLSYDEGAPAEIVLIFNQILSNFKLNAGYYNADAGGLTGNFGRCCRDVSSCLTTEDFWCYSDEICRVQNSGHCTSDKAKLTRDTRRLSDLQYLNYLLNGDASGYHQTKRCNNDHSKLCVRDADCYGGGVCGFYYPILNAGTYIAGRSFSVWPSWQATLGGLFGSAMPVDPLNRLYSCPTQLGYDAATCWNESSKSMACPDENRAYVYTYYALNGGQSRGVYAKGEYDSTGLKWHSSASGDQRGDWGAINLFKSNYNPNPFAGLVEADMCR